jgi:hypothetical protein
LAINPVGVEKVSSPERLFVYEYHLVEFFFSHFG